MKSRGLISCAIIAQLIFALVFAYAKSRFSLDHSHISVYSEIVDKPGVDVFGNFPAKKQLECTCPNCQRNLAASRFAPHLEKCMGMGRNSSRIASRRSQKALKDNETRYIFNVIRNLKNGMLTSNLSLVVRKPVFGVSDQIPHKPGCRTTQDG